MTTYVGILSRSRDERTVLLVTMPLARHLGGTKRTLEKHVGGKSMMRMVTAPPGKTGSAPQEKILYPRLGRGEPFRKIEFGMGIEFHADFQRAFAPQLVEIDVLDSGKIRVHMPTEPLKEPKDYNGRKVKEPGIVVGHDLRAEDPGIVGDEELEFLRQNGVVSRDEMLEENARFVAERGANNTEGELAAVVAQAMPAPGGLPLVQVEEPRKGFWARFFGI